MRIARLAHAAAALLVLLSVGSSCQPPPAPPVVAPAVAAQPAPSAAAAPADPEDAPLPLDARVHEGKLANGLTYYVLAHGKPEHRAQIWLAVNAGSVLEDDDQRGLAHFVEHMGFNGTKRFPKQALIDMLEKSGVAFGADLNAHTSFDETVYTLQVPTDSPELLDKAVDVVRDWSDSVTFDPVEVDKERGVVLEEWRLGRGARMRIFDKQAPVIFHGSKYADRLAIGKPEVIQHASRDTLVRFYKDWYRPDLMAVIAVGDFDAAAMEAKIKTEFASVAPATHPRPRPLVLVPAYDKELASVVTDPEATSTQVAVMTKLPSRPMASTRDYRRTLAEALYNTMLNARLDEVRRKPNAPFLGASSWSGHAVRTADAFTQGVSVKDDGVLAGLGALTEEMLRVERHGFAPGELTRAKSDLLRRAGRAVVQRATQDSRQFAEEIERNFFTGEAMPGPEAELALTRQLLSTITVEELDQLGQSLAKGSRVITVSGPPAMTRPTDDALLGTVQTVASKDIPAYDDGPNNVPLMATAPTPGAVVSTKTIPELGVTVWTMKNGVRVVVKPTDFRADEVRMSAFAHGGTSIASDADYDSAEWAGTVVSQGGLGSFDATTLRKLLAGKVASVNAHIGELGEGVGGSASPDDLETLLQMTYLSFTAPRKDEAAFESWRAREAETVKNRRLSPETAFREDIGLFYAQNHRRRRPTTPEVVAKVNLDKAFAFYKDRFADASGFTFVLVGNLDLDRTKKLAETYLGSLPAKGHKEAWRDVHVNHPRGVAKKEMKQGTEPKSSVWLTFHGDEAWSRDASNDMRMLNEVLRIRLREVLREDMGGVYGVSARGSVIRRPTGRFGFTVSFGCAPENVEKLEKAVFDEIKAVQDHGIGDDYVTKVKAQRRRAHETDLRDNGYWLRELEDAYSYGDDPKVMLDFDAMLDKVTSQRIQKAAKKYLSSSQYTLGELRPAAAGEAARTANP